MPSPPDRAADMASRHVADDYWKGASQGKLVLQRCCTCGRIRHYPRPLCDACYSFEFEPVEAHGTGVVHSWTVAHHAFDPSVADEVPYVLVTVGLDEGVRVLGRLVSGGPARIGLPVHTSFVPGPDGAPVLVLEADGPGGGPTPPA